MPRFPWTKLQDFYLRLGFLKVLAAASSPDRRSIFADALTRRLEAPLLLPATSFPELWMHVEQKITWYRKDHAKGKKLDHPTVAEAILVAAVHASYLYAVTRKSTYKIIDWGRDVELLGSGNQITERGLLFRGFIPPSRIEKFFDGNVLAWNPFALELGEKLLFLYHLSEIDHTMLELASDFGGWNEVRPMESADAAQFMCRAMLQVLAREQSRLRPRDVPVYRVATELARTIALELKMEQEFQASKLGGSQSSATDVPRLPPTKNIIGGKVGTTSGRVGHKNADHQTIPRVEQLVDLGFLRKPGSENAKAAREPKRRWCYEPTDVCRRWREFRRRTSVTNEEFLKDGFAQAAVFAFHGHQVGLESSRDVTVVGKHFWEAYDRIGRRHGNSPLDSIALYAMTSAAAEGAAIEMVCFERLMNAIKGLSALPDDVFFAGGNDLDTMFIRIKSGFLNALEVNRTSIQSAYQA